MPNMICYYFFIYLLTTGVTVSYLHRVGEVHSVTPGPVT